MTLEQYLREALDRQVDIHMMRAQKHDDGAVTFYIHPAFEDGDTRDFEVHESVVLPDPRVTRPS
jgi:hypothetical protein